MLKTFCTFFKHFCFFLVSLLDTKYKDYNKQRMRQLKITKQITNRDSLSFNKYLAEVSSMSDVITSEEEIELTRRIKAGDLEAREKLVKANLRFVISVAKQYSGQGPLPDLINEGNIGLIKAAERFDETRGFKFISFGVWWIRQSIQQYIAENNRNIRLPLNKIGTLNKIKKAQSELEQLLERWPTETEVSDYLMSMEEDKKNGDPGKYRIDKVSELIGYSKPITSLDAPLSNDDEAGSLLDVMESNGDEHDIQRAMEHNDLTIELKRSMSALSDRERMVLTHFFGLFGERQMSLEEIGYNLDLTRERVRQIKEKGVRRMKSTFIKRNLKQFA